MTLYLWLVFSRASGDSGNSPYTVGTCRGLFFVPFPSFPWWIEREALPAGAQWCHPCLWDLTSSSSDPSYWHFFLEYFLKRKETPTQPSWLCTEGSVKPARQRWLCCPYPVPLPGLPFSGRTTLAALRSRKAGSREAPRPGRARPLTPAGRVGNAEKPFALSLWFIFLLFTWHCILGESPGPPQQQQGRVTVPSAVSHFFYHGFVL